jgi:endonuclease G
MPVGDRLRLHTDFLLSFDTRLRNPRWVLEHISRDKLRSRQGTRQNSQFAEDAGG